MVGQQEGRKIQFDKIVGQTTSWAIWRSTGSFCAGSFSSQYVEQFNETTENEKWSYYLRVIRDPSNCACYNYSLYKVLACEVLHWRGCPEIPRMVFSLPPPPGRFYRIRWASKNLAHDFVEHLKTSLLIPQIFFSLSPRQLQTDNLWYPFNLFSTSHNTLHQRIRITLRLQIIHHGSRHW